MRPRKLGVWLAVLVATVLGVAPGSGAALPRPRGSRAALRLVRRVLAEVAHTESITWRQVGGSYACPSRDGIPLRIAAGRRPHRGCRPESLVVAQNLRRGRIDAQLVTYTARRFPLVRVLSDPTGTWTWTSKANCWRLTGRRGRLIPAISYAGERVSVAVRGGSIRLRGRAPGFSELDVIDRRTDQIRFVQTAAATRGGAVIRARAMFTYSSTRQSFPAPTPLCASQARIIVKPDRPFYTLGDQVKLRVRLPGSADASQPIHVFAAGWPYRHYQSVDTAQPHAGHATVPLVMFDRSGTPYAPVRNTRVYVTDGTQRSSTITVYVEPRSTLGVNPYGTGSGSGPNIAATYRVDVHLMRRYPRPRVFFYERPAGARVFSLIGIDRLRPIGQSFEGEFLDAYARVRGSGRITFAACVRRRIVADMGRAFDDRRCGAAHARRVP